LYEVSKNIKILRSCIGKKVGGEFDVKLDRAIEQYDSELLQFIFLFKWYPVRNEKVVEELEEYLMTKELNKVEKQEKFSLKRKKIVDFILPLLWFFHNTKQKIT
jgi:hypothetical protein